MRAPLLNGRGAVGRVPRPWYLGDCGHQHAPFPRPWRRGGEQQQLAVHTTTEIFNRGGQNWSTVAGNATATDERPRLIVALTVAVVQPPRLIC